MNEEELLEYKKKIEMARSNLSVRKKISLDTALTKILEEYFGIYEIWPENLQKDPTIIIIGLLSKEDEQKTVDCIRELYERRIIFPDRDIICANSYDNRIHLFCGEHGSVLTEYIRTDPKGMPDSMPNSPLLNIPNMINNPIKLSNVKNREIHGLEEMIIHTRRDADTLIDKHRPTIQQRPPFSKEAKLIYICNFDMLALGIIQKAAKDVPYSYLSLIRHR